MENALRRIHIAHMFCQRKHTIYTSHSESIHLKIASFCSVYIPIFTHAQSRAPKIYVFHYYALRSSRPTHTKKQRYSAKSNSHTSHIWSPRLSSPKSASQTTYILRANKKYSAINRRHIEVGIPRPLSAYTYIVEALRAQTRWNAMENGSIKVAAQPG